MKSINTLLYPFLLSALAILLTGCGSSPTAVMDDMISEMNGLTEVLEGIESQEDYDSAQDDIEKRAKKIEALAETLKGMDEPEFTQEEKKEYMGKVMVATLKMTGAAMKASVYGFKMPDMK